MEGGEGVDEAGPHPFKGFLEGLQVHPFLIGGHGDEPWPIGPKGLEGPHVAWGLHQNRASLVQKDLADEVQPLLASRGDQDLLHIHPEPFRHPGPKGQVPLSWAVLEGFFP